MTALQIVYTSNGMAGLRLPTLIGKVFVPLRDIVRLEGQRNYTVFVLNGGRKIMVAKTIGLFAAFLPPMFVRVNRGCIINTSYMIVSKEGGYCLRDGFKIPVSRRRVKELEAIRQVA